MDSGRPRKGYEVGTNIEWYERTTTLLLPFTSLKFKVIETRTQETLDKAKDPLPECRRTAPMWKEMARKIDSQRDRMSS